MSHDEAVKALTLRGFTVTIPGSNAKAGAGLAMVRVVSAAGTNVMVKVGEELESLVAGRLFMSDFRQRREAEAKLAPKEE